METKGKTVGWKDGKKEWKGWMDENEDMMEEWNGMKWMDERKDGSQSATSN